MRFPDPPRRETGENLIPMINIVFLLLIFFMVAGAFSNQDAPPFMPPDSRSETTLDESTVALLLHRDGSVTLADESAGAATWTVHLASVLATHPNAVITVKADRDAAADMLLDLLAQLRGAGVAQIQLLTLRGG